MVSALRRVRTAKAVIASALALGLVAEAGIASPQPYGYDQDPGPPQGQYAPPPGEAPDYSDQYRQQDQAYANAYSDWAAALFSRCWTQLRAAQSE